MQVSQALRYTDLRPAKLPRFLAFKQTEKIDPQLPPVAGYDCVHVATGPVIDGRLDDPVWVGAPWSNRFVKMDDGSPAALDSRVALLWDSEFLYVAFQLEDHDIRGTHVLHHEHVYLRDSDAELFIEGEGKYYEIGINPLSTIYEVLWTWIEPIVRDARWRELDQLFRLNHSLYIAPRRSEEFGRLGDLDWELHGLRRAVRIDGALNCPEVRDQGWSVEMALPWTSLEALGKPVPPTPGDVWRIGACRCQHRWDPNGTESVVDWSWNRHGFVNMHIPERWTAVRFVDTAY